MAEMGVCIAGVGAETPEGVIGTAEVEERVGIARFGFPSGWLEAVTGVRARHWADPDVEPSDLAAAAGRQALADAHVEPAEVDVLIFTGITRNFIEPATAPLMKPSISTKKSSQKNTP